MTCVLAVCNQKGGVGKTTVVRELAAAYCEAGLTVLAVDIDRQRNLTRRYGVDPGQIATLYDVLASRLMRGQDELSITDVIVHDVLDGVDLVPGDKLLADVELALGGVATRRERYLARVLEPARGVYDVVLLDCPPSLGLLTVNALVAADEVLVPVDMSVSDSLDGAEDLIGILRDLEEDSPRLVGLLRNRIAGSDRARPLVLQAMEADMADLGVPILATRVPATVKIEHAAMRRTSMASGYADLTATQAFRDLARELQPGAAA